MSNFPIESFQYKLLAEGYKFFTDFVEELIDYGIETVEQFQDCYQGRFDSVAQFTEEIINDCYTPSNLPDWVDVDYQSTWDRNLRFDYFTFDDIESEAGYVHIFNNY